MPKRITNEELSNDPQHADRNRKNGNHPRRVILLLDLDCFYAQAVCVRLGWDAATTALALLQWNSVLAVTYPARQLYNIKRGDSWEAVRRKSGNQCHAVHVPVLTTAETTKDEQPEPGNEAGEAGATTTTTLQQDYDRWFRLSSEQQTAARQAELGVRRYSTEGKACIECFRIASAVIFAQVHAFLQEQMPTAVVLERASIDEFFLDVTAAVDFLEEHAPDTDEDLVTKKAVQNTVVIGNDASSNSAASSSTDPGENEDQDMDAAETRRWQRGCWIAHQIRTAVHETLGFTMSAGIGPNKTIAKLAASYGKPAGQAICYPQQIEGLLQRTEIRSCRNLGGKLGASLQKLLPPQAPTTVGSIARYLSLPVLRQAFPPRDSPGTAEWIHQMARGVDSEAVQAKTEQAAVLVKSITAFKSLNFIVPTSNDNSDNGDSNRKKRPPSEGHTLAQASRWIQLLAQEVVTRVERDAHRHHRYPRVCTIQYTPTTASSRTGSRGNSSKSVRVPFPAERLSTAQKVEQLLSAVPRAIAGKESGEVRLNGVGLCAIDFEARGRGSQSIDSFFTSSSISSTASGGDARTAAAAAAPNSVQGTTTAAAQSPTQSTSSRKRPRVSSSSKKPAVVVDADLELAKKLQAQYDRENRVWEVLDKTKKKKQKRGGDAGKSAAVTSHRIDTFFQKKT